MVLTDLPFKQGKLLHSRYHNIRRPVSAPPGKAEDTKSEDGQESKEYAAFLKYGASQIDLGYCLCLVHKVTSLPHVFPFYDRVNEK